MYLVQNQNSFIGLFIQITIHFAIISKLPALITVLIPPMQVHLLLNLLRLPDIYSERSFLPDLPLMIFLLKKAPATIITNIKRISK